MHTNLPEPVVLMCRGLVRDHRDNVVTRAVVREGQLIGIHEDTEVRCYGEIPWVHVPTVVDWLSDNCIDIYRENPRLIDLGFIQIDLDPDICEECTEYSHDCSTEHDRCPKHREE